VRRLPTIMLGALMLPVGFLPTAAFADSAPDPAVTATATATPTPEPSVTATATDSPTPTATPVPADPGDDYLTGAFGLKPASGKPGTVITLSSKDPCVDADGKVGSHVEVFVISETDYSDDTPVTLDEVISTDATGGWTATAKVPATAKTGEVYFADAACFAAGVKVDDDATPFLVYDYQEFTVTQADKAPVASPVPGNPHFTG
jgi:hypothetical protein